MLHNWPHLYQSALADVSDLCEWKARDQGGYYPESEAAAREGNRWLALPRFHGRNPQLISDMTPEQRTGYWSAAIAKASDLWGDEWGIAVNSDDRRTQCHAHIHIGKLLQGIETARFVEVDAPAQIPVPEGGTGLWVHPQGSKLHVHLTEQITETVLLR